MLPFIAGAVILGASAVAWYYNEQTAQEKSRQNRAYRQRDSYYSSYNEFADRATRGFTEKQKEQAKKYKKLLLDEVKENSKKIADIAKSLDEVFNLILIEITSDTTSPYRRSALQREFPRIQDAQVRLKQYKKYLKFEKKRINEHWENKRLDSLMSLEISNPLLPLEWLYPGKLILADISDIGKSQPNFNHRFFLNGFNGQKEQQEALALNYGEDFPVLIVKEGKKKDGLFYGCVARGISFYDHIRTNEATEMVIEGYYGRNKAYRGSIFDGLIKITLPELNLLNPSLRCVDGQKISVFYDSFDATLSHNPSGKEDEKGRKPFVTVSEKAPAFLGKNDLELFIEVQEKMLKKITDDFFYSDESKWTLIDHVHETKEITLGKASVQVICEPTINNDGLKVLKISQHQTAQVGVDIPFDFILASENIEPHTLFSWPYGLEQFYTFASQVLINEEKSKERVIQVEFFKRWEHVLAYQKRHETEVTVEFSSDIVTIDNKSSQIIVPSNIVKPPNNEGCTISSLFEDIEKSGYLRHARCCSLYVWNTDKQNYLHAIHWKWLHKSEYRLTSNGSVKIQASFYKELESSSSHRFKLEVILPNSALSRQQQALDGLFEDRLVEPRLKEIFLSPSHYQPEYIPYWKDNEIKWHGQLTLSQKQVVKTALSAKHITMVQGPPGTGKTTTIVEMLYQLLTHHPDQRILVVSQQNTAVDNALTKFKNMFPELIGDSINIVRIGNPDKIDDDITENHFDKIYSDFLSDRLQYVERNSHTLDEAIQNTAYEWASLLREMKSRASDYKVSDEFFTTMLANKNLIGATCVGLAARKAGVDNLEFDVTIVDEAGRATVPELLIPLLRTKKAILIGDHHQLPPSIAPILREDSAKKEMAFLKDTFLESSFFETLFEQLPEGCTSSLKEQFRMAPPIGDLVADLFYIRNGKRQLTNGLGDKFNSDNYVHSDCLSWFDIRGKQEKPKNSTSWHNKREADAINTYLRKLAKTSQRSISVAVITPYSAQKKMIRKLLGSKYGHQETKLGNLKIKVDTVDSFQGSEAELVCYSTVRTFGSLQFLLDKKRLNVACSRAKENLLFFGHSNYLMNWKPKEGEKNLFSEIVNKAVLCNMR